VLKNAIQTRDETLMNRGSRYGSTTLQTVKGDPANKGKRKGRGCYVPALVLLVELTTHSG
jgi:hypothetical protein